MSPMEDPGTDSTLSGAVNEHLVNELAAVSAY